ncbi:MAG: hypothetical protein ALAOOOJD_00748 [bacterium]|nr:hypothetical protein [bacterium]
MNIRVGKIEADLFEAKPLVDLQKFLPGRRGNPFSEWRVPFRSMNIFRGMPRGADV